MKNEIPGFLNGKKDTLGQVAMNVVAIIVLFSIGAALAAGV